MSTLEDVRSEVPQDSLRALLKNRAQDSWAALDAAPGDRAVPGTLIVVGLAGLVALVAAVLSIRSGAGMAFGDAQAHLTIARRVTDSLAPGFSQLGTVWLPIPQLLLLPLVQSTTLWHTGISGAILGGVALMGITSGVYRISARLGIRRFGRLAAVMVILTNSSLVYECTTAMTEPTLIMWLVASVAGLTRWTMSKRELSAGELMVFSGLPAAAALLSRYEGWALTFVGTLVVALVAWRRRRELKYAVKMALAFALWPFIALSWWLIYNFAVFGNPLEFATGQYSASALQVGLPNKGFLLYQGYGGLTIWTYAWALIQTVGILLIILGIIGAFVLAWRRGLDNHVLMVWMLAVPSGFIIFAMYVGQTVMSNDHALPAALWNNRFALSALPFIGILIAYLCQSLAEKSILRRVGFSVVAAAIVLQAAWWVVDLDHSAVFAEASASTAQKVDSGAQAAMRYLGANYDGGSILIDESGGILPEIGIPLREYYNVSIGDLYTAALADPAAHVRWVFMRGPTNGNGDGDRGDAIYAAVGRRASFLSNYAEVYKSGPFRIYRRIGN